MNRRDFIIGAVGSPLASLLAEPIIVAAPEWPDGRLPNISGGELAEMWAAIMPEWIEDMREMMDEMPGVSDFVAGGN